jgi:hypothetical protein
MRETGPGQNGGPVPASAAVADTDSQVSLRSAGTAEAGRRPPQPPHQLPGGLAACEGTRGENCRAGFQAVTAGTG